jgi:hypothetical protein
MLNSRVWENEAYRIEINDERAFATKKEGNLKLADIVYIGDTDETMRMLKRIIVFHELGNPKEDVVWENESYKLEFGFRKIDLRLVLKSENDCLLQFNLDNVEVVEVIKKVIAFL